mmetsp:Transcript_47372/g.133673  ORF Transcript_47372/g.133673 Transcript_47372/m.133673 type:complete len:230 (+) Transcript_47372:1009-1698(+)
MTVKPSEYVPSIVTKSATRVIGVNSSRLLTRSVFSKDRSRSWQNFRDFESTSASCSSLCTTESGPSHCARWTWRYLLRKLTTRRSSAMKCSARRMFPGMASLTTSSGSALPRMFSATCASIWPAWCKPSTSRRYSSCSLPASSRFTRSTSLPNRARLPMDWSSRTLFSFTLRDSMHTSSMLCASSNTTMLGSTCPPPAAWGPPPGRPSAVAGTPPSCDAMDTFGSRTYW